jgi:transposase
LQDLLGVHLSAGSIATFVRASHRQLAEVEMQIKAALVKAAVIHQDETGLRVGKTGQWVHVCSTEHLTHDAAHPKRGREALKAIGMMDTFLEPRFTMAWQAIRATRAAMPCATFIICAN